MACLLNHFCVVSIATGSANAMALLPFLDEVVWEPLRLGLVPRPVAFESLLLYLTMLEDTPGYHLSSIVVQAGGMDVKRQEAVAMAEGLYAAECFRTHGGKPSGGAPRGSKDPEAPYVGTVKGNPDAKKCCYAYNHGVAHLNKHVGPNGLCHFKHVCQRCPGDLPHPFGSKDCKFEKPAKE